MLMNGRNRKRLGIYGIKLCLFCMNKQYYVRLQGALDLIASLQEIKTYKNSKLKKLKIYTSKTEFKNSRKQNINRVHMTQSK